MHPFDLKSILMAKHAQHVVLVHFPIALTIVGISFDFAAQYRRDTVLARVAYYNLCVAAVSTVPVVLTGILAWRWQLEGQRLTGILLLHFSLAMVTTIFIWVVWNLHLRNHRHSEGQPSAIRVAVELVTLAAIMLTAHLGGFLTGVNGTG